MKTGERALAERMKELEPGIRPTPLWVRLVTCAVLTLALLALGMAFGI